MAALGAEDGVIAYRKIGEALEGRAVVVVNDRYHASEFSHTLSHDYGVLTPMLEGVVNILKDNAVAAEELEATLRLLSVKANDDSHTYKDNSNMNVRESISCMRDIVSQWVDAERKRLLLNLVALDKLADCMADLDSDFMIAKYESTAVTLNAGSGNADEAHNTLTQKESSPSEAGEVPKPITEKIIRTKSRGDKLEMSSSKSNSSGGLFGGLRRKTKSLTTRKKRPIKPRSSEESGKLATAGVDSVPEITHTTQNTNESESSVPNSSVVSAENVKETTNAEVLVAAEVQAASTPSADDSDSFSDDDGNANGKPAIMVKIRPQGEKAAQNDEVDLSSFRLDRMQFPAGAHARRDRGKTQDSFALSESRWKNEESNGPPTMPTAPTNENTSPTLARRNTASAMSGVAGAGMETEAESSRQSQLTQAVAMQAALTETCNVYFKGSTVGKSLVSGKLMLSFNQCIIKVLEDSLLSSNPPVPLSLVFTTVSPLSQIVTNPAFCSDTQQETQLPHGGSMVLEVSVSTLLSALKQRNPPSPGVQMVGKSYRVTLMTYQAVSTGNELVPMFVNTVWDCRNGETTVICNYNIATSGSMQRMEVSDISMAVHMSGGRVISCVSESSKSKWDERMQKLEWTIPDFSPSHSPTSGSCVAKFKVDGISTKSKNMVKFISNNTTVTGAMVQNSRGASAHMVLKKVIKRTTTGKYISDFSAPTKATNEPNTVVMGQSSVGVLPDKKTAGPPSHSPPKRQTPQSANVPGEPPSAALHVTEEQ
eukprot:CFRG2507T1